MNCGRPWELGGAGVSARPSLAIHSIVPGGAKLVSKAGLDGRTKMMMMICRCYDGDKQTQR